MNKPQTIAEIYDLDDSWRKHTTFDELGQAYAKPFVDPPDDDSMAITSNSRTIFHRVKVNDRRLIEIVSVDNSIPIVAVCMHNNRVGCWVAFTSLRIAQRICAALIAAGMTAEWDTCDRHGETIVG